MTIENSKITCCILSEEVYSISFARRTIMFLRTSFLTGSILLGMTVLLLVTPVFSDYNFQWANPTPQGNALHALAFESDLVVYAVGDKGTVLKTVDGGVTWVDLTDWPVMESDLHDVLVIGPGEVLAAGESPGLFGSTDGGASWTPIDNPSTGTLYCVEETGPGTLSAVGDDGEVIRSTDGGTTWTALTSTGAFRLLEQYWLDADRGYVVGEYQGRRTTNGGQTWELIPGFGEWEPFTNVVFRDDLTGYLFGDFSTWKTTDGGATWTERFHLPDAPIYQRQVLFHDANHRVVTTGLEGAQIWETTDDGTTWTMLHERVSGIGFHDVVVLPGGCMLLVSTDGDLSRSDDTGQSWTNATFSFGGSERVSMDALVALPGGVFLAGGNPGSMGPPGMLWLRSGDAGATWNEMPTPPALGHVSDVDHFGDELIAVAGRDGNTPRVCCSRDAGLTWQSFDPPLSNQGIDAVTVPTDSVAFFITRGHNLTEVWRTTDHGTSWHRRDSGLPSTGDFRDIFFVDALTGYASGGSVGVASFYGTTDGGASWNAVPPTGLQPVITTMHWFNESTGVGGGSWEIYRTTNGGGGWTEVDDQYGAYSFHFRDDLHGVTIRYSEETLRVTSDGGLTWTPVGLPFPGPYGGLISVAEGFYLGGSGSVILRAQDEGAVSAETPVARIEKGGLQALYPNPFGSRTTVLYSVERPGHIQLTIYDVQGRLVRTLADRFEDRGRRTAVWDGRTVSGEEASSGVYFARLKTRDFTVMRRIVRVK
jgi:photosystem II stability/assembly factor-like uncharacterized protein